MGLVRPELSNFEQLLASARWTDHNLDPWLIQGPFLAWKFFIYPFSFIHVSLPRDMSVKHLGEDASSGMIHAILWLVGWAYDGKDGQMHGTKVLDKVEGSITTTVA